MAHSWNPYANQFSANAQARYYESERERMMREQMNQRESRLSKLYQLGDLSASHYQEEMMNILAHRATQPTRQQSQSLGDSLDAMRYGIDNVKASIHNNESILQQYTATTNQWQPLERPRCNSCRSSKCNGEVNFKGRCRGKQEEFNHKLHMLHSARLAKKKV